ncbi:hypothetical protein RSAG8_08080, partial [Rhizoctonia solani AG-8 WAC10335]
MSESILPVAIIGAGLGGIATGIALQTQLGCYDYQIFEMSNGIGGTWLENTYPGCACDVPCHWYSLSTELNPNWSQLYVGYKEIRSYWERVAAKHDIVSHIQFFTEVLSLVWDEGTQANTIYRLGPFTSTLRRRREKACIDRLKRLAPEKYHENLIPKFPMGCKRIIYDPGYLESLQRSNVDLEWDTISGITENGITTKSGSDITLGKHYEFDIICFATGFDVENSSDINEQGGPTAYMGTTVPDFPNFFTLLGPNTATGHGSVIHSEEVQINYAMQLIKPVIRGQAKSFVPKARATQAYNDYLQEELKHTVWTSCISWYHAGENRRGKLMTWPATQTYMWWMGLNNQTRSILIYSYEGICKRLYLQRCINYLARCA